MVFLLPIWMYYDYVDVMKMTKLVSYIRVDVLIQYIFSNITASWERKGRGKEGGREGMHATVLISII